MQRRGAMMKKNAMFKQLLNSPEILVMPGVHDALSARLAQQAGFSALTMGGYGVAASVLGQPDVGYLTMTEMVYTLKRICDVTTLPLLADADTGYGNAANVFRVVKEYEDAGAAALFLEDQEWPKRCGHMEGKRVISMEEHVMKIRAAVAARRDPDFVIMARTDARSVFGLDEAIRRGNAYAEAGADLIFIEAPQNIEELVEVRRQIKKPLLANMVENGKTPLLSAEELQKIGYNAVVFPVSSVYTVAAALRDLWSELKETGSTKQYAASGKMISFGEFNQLVGLPAYKEIERKFAAD
jgi:carboxyvinyl-carboxyphosphonate phosphorylmutase